MDCRMVSLQMLLEARPTLRVVSGDLRIIAFRIEYKNFLAAASEVGMGGGFFGLHFVVFGSCLEYHMASSSFARCEYLL